MAEPRLTHKKIHVQREIPVTKQTALRVSAGLAALAAGSALTAASANDDVMAIQNDPAQVGALGARFDFAVVEECFAYEDCGRFSPFVCVR